MRFEEVAVFPWLYEFNAEQYTCFASEKDGLIDVLICDDDQDMLHVAEGAFRCVNGKIKSVKCLAASPYLQAMLLECAKQTKSVISEMSRDGRTPARYQENPTQVSAQEGT